MSLRLLRPIDVRSSSSRTRLIPWGRHRLCICLLLRIRPVPIVSGRCGGKAHHHGAPTTRGVVHVEVATDRLDEPAGHGQPQSYTGLVLGIAQPLERSEYQVAILGWYPWTVIHDTEVDPSGHGTGLDPEAGAPTMYQRVVDQVGHGPLEENGIGIDPGEVVGYIRCDRCRPRPQAGHRGVDYVADVGGHVHDLH